MVLSNLPVYGEGFSKKLSSPYSRAIIKFVKFRKKIGLDFLSVRRVS